MAAGDRVGDQGMGRTAPAVGSQLKAPQHEGSSMKATAAAVALMTTQLSDLLFGIGVGMGAALCQALQAFLGVGMDF